MADRTMYMGSWFVIDDEEKAADVLMEALLPVGTIKGCGIDACLAEYDWDYDRVKHTLCLIDERIADDGEEAL